MPPIAQPLGRRCCRSLVTQHIGLGATVSDQLQRTVQVAPRQHRSTIWRASPVIAVQCRHQTWRGAPRARPALRDRDQFTATSRCGLAFLGTAPIVADWATGFLGNSCPLAPPGPFFAKGPLGIERCPPRPAVIIQAGLAAPSRSTRHRCSPWSAIPGQGRLRPPEERRVGGRRGGADGCSIPRA
jgi:hypothetical protein